MQLLGSRSSPCECFQHTQTSKISHQPGTSKENTTAEITSMEWNPLYANSISNIESGGNYNLLGPVTKSGDRAYGKYQVMGSNIPSLDPRKPLARDLTPAEFRADPQAQDAVFQHRVRPVRRQVWSRGRGQGMVRWRVWDE